MKIQKRIGLFETNSSSTHSITIGGVNKNLKISEFVGDTLKFGSKPIADVYDEYLDRHMFLLDGVPKNIDEIQFRANFLWYAFTYNKRRTKKLRKKIKAALKDVGVMAVFNDEPREGYFEFDYDAIVFEPFVDLDNEEFSEALLRFLIGDVLYYAFDDDGYSDEDYNRIYNEIDAKLKRIGTDKFYQNEYR